MTPQERELIVDLFGQLADVENEPREREVERAIADGLRRAPNAVYPLVQTVLVQGEALDNAGARIDELEQQLGYGEPQQQQGGFLDSMRDMLFGGGGQQQGGANAQYGGGQEQPPTGPLTQDELRQLLPRINDLFGRLAALEGTPRDPDAERTIAQGLARAPNAVYGLVQTALGQTDDLTDAQARIRELQDEIARTQSQTQRPTGFGGAGRAAGGSVPGVRPGETPMGVPGGFRTNAPPTQPDAMQARGMPPGGPGGPAQQQQGGAGGSFLGTAAAAAVGAIGGSLLMDSLRSTLGGQKGGGQSALDPSGGGESRSPWGGGDSSRGDLARDAGANDIGRGGSGDAQRSGMFDTASNQADDNGDDGYDDDGYDDGNDDDDGGDFGEA